MDSKNWLEQKTYCSQCSANQQAVKRKTSGQISHDLLELISFEIFGQKTCDGQ